MYFDYTNYAENEAEELKEKEEDIIKSLSFFNKNMYSRHFQDQATFFKYYNRDII